MSRFSDADLCESSFVACPLHRFASPSMAMSPSFSSGGGPMMEHVQPLTVGEYLEEVSTHIE